MITTRRDISREQVIWLCLHGLFLAAVGALLVFDGSEYFGDIAEHPFSRATIALAGRLTMVAAGVLITVIAGIRLFRPFAVGRMEFRMGPLVLGEAIFVCLTGGLILDCGQTGFLALLLAYAFNLSQLGFKKL